MWKTSAAKFLLIEVIYLAVTFQTRICSIFISIKWFVFYNLLKTLSTDATLEENLHYFDKLWEMLNNVQQQKFQMHYSKSDFFLRAYIYFNI